MSQLLSPERINHLTGFGMTSSGDSYHYRPTQMGEIAEVLQVAKATSRQVVLRGAGRSYGDASIQNEAISVDLGRMNQIYSFSKRTGEVECGPGVTIEQLWRLGIEDGFWPPVVSGTMHPTLGGALGMNIHGKNNFAAGTLGEHVTELDVLFPQGDVRSLTPDNALFHAVISSAGLLGVIVRVKLKLKRIQSGDLRVLQLSIKNWEHQFRTFLDLENEADYMVTWVDCFAKGGSAGRGTFHAGWYAEESDVRPSTLLPAHQDLPDTMVGVPKSIMWRLLKPLNNRLGMTFLNGAKYAAGAALGDGKSHGQSLVGFSFLLDYVPNWQKSYLPGGFIQYQSFVPKQKAPEVFARQIELSQKARLESFLGVMKRHRLDPFLFSHGVDGFSLAMDFKITPSNRAAVWNLAHRMNDLVLDAGGKFYLAKDSTMRPGDFRASIGEESWSRFHDLKAEMDPDCLLTSALAKRLELDPRR